MKLAFAEQMRALDNKAQTEFGLPGDLLMERAAWAGVQAVRAVLGSMAGKRVTVCCGKGNNGGDGLALARQLQAEGAEVAVLLAFPPQVHQGLARINLERAEKFGVPILTWNDEANTYLEWAELIVDALLGTGTRGAPQDPVQGLINAINNQVKPVVALDLPSGIDADTGAVSGVAVRATRTVSFGLAQPGLYSYPGATFAGEVVVDGIGFPRALLEDSALRVEALSDVLAKTMVPARTATAHKGTTGHLLVIGGALGMTGAPVLTALAALRSGCGLVTVGLREPGLLPEKPLEVMTVVWPEVLARPGRYKAMVFGPGLSTADDGRDLLWHLLRTAQCPLIIDADGLNLLGENPEFLAELAQPAVLTPHPGEMARLTGLSIEAIQQDRIGVATRYAGQWRATVVLKGARTIIAMPDGRIYINLTGNPGMATAGMGDALAGVIGGLTVQGMPAGDAAVLGAYLHGLAGDLVCHKQGPVGMMASDLLGELGAAFKKVLTVESI